MSQTGHQVWDIVAQTGTGTLTLSDGGARLSMDGRVLADGPVGEYRGVNQRFQLLIEAGASEVDSAPLAHVADAFMLGRRIIVEPFDD